MNPNPHDPVDTFVKRADEFLCELAKAPSVRHLRLAGAELLRAVRCGLDEAIDHLEPKHAKPECHAKSDTPPTP